MKPLKLSSLVFLAICAISSYAQLTQTWQVPYNGTANGGDRAYAVAVDKRGNTYVAGQSDELVTGTDYMTIKYGPSGNLVWKRPYFGVGSGGTDIARAIAVDNEGNVYVTGESQGGGGGQGALYDIATAKYDTNGALLWAVRLNYNNQEDFGTDIAVNAAGHVFVTGSTGQYDGTKDFITIRYNENGVQQTGWPQTYDRAGLNDQAVALAVGPGDDVFVTGQSFHPSTFGDWATIKYAGSGGQELWARFVTGDGRFQNKDDLPTDIDVDSQSSVFVCGGVFHETHADMGTISYAGADGSTRWGVLLYTARPNDGYDQARALALERDHTGKAEYVYVTGFAQPVENNWDYATVRYPGTSASTHDWAATYNGLGGSSVDFAWDIAVAGNGNSYVTGNSADDIATIKYNKQGVQQSVARFTAGTEGKGLGIAVSCAGKAHVTGHATYSTIDYQSILYSQPVASVAVGTLIVDAGENPLGNVASLLTSDDNRYTIQPGPVFSTNQYPIRLILDGTLAEGQVLNELCFQIESSASVANISQRVELFDFESGSYVLVDEREATTADSVLYLSAPYNANRFVQAGNGNPRVVRARVQFKQAGAVFIYPWRGQIDFAGWKVLQ